MAARGIATAWAALLLALCLLIAPATPALAEQVGNCRQCHLNDSSRVLGQLSWQGPLEQESLMPCPGRRALLEELWATESLLNSLGGSLPNLARQGYYVDPWRQGLLEAKARLHQILTEPLEDGQVAARRLGEVRGLLQERVLDPMLEQSQRSRHRLWWGVLSLGGLLLALAWVVGLRRGLPPEPAKQVFAQVKAGRLP